MNIAILTTAGRRSGGLFEYTETMIEVLLQLRLEKEIKQICIFDVSGEFSSYKGKVDHYVTVHITKSLPYLWPLLYKYCQNLITKIFFKDFRIKYDVAIYPAQDLLLGLIPSKVQVCCVHDLMHIYEKKFSESGFFIRRILRNLRFQNIANNADRILLETPLGLKQYQQNYEVQANKLYVVPYAVNKKLVKYRESLKQNGKIFSPYADNTFLYPATFWQHKNHDAIIKATKLLKDSGTQIKVFFTGEINELAKSLMQEIKNLGLDENIFFLGRVSERELYDLYNQTDTLIYPSFYGPSNLPPIEAIFLGKTPIVANVYDAKEVYKDNALYFDPNEPSDLAELLLVYISTNDKVKVYRHNDDFHPKTMQDSLKIALKEA